jgi:hypothetical protein
MDMLKVKLSGMFIYFVWTEALTRDNTFNHRQLSETTAAINGIIGKSPKKSVHPMSSPTWIQQFVHLQSTSKGLGLAPAQHSDCEQFKKQDAKEI